MPSAPNPAVTDFLTRYHAETGEAGVEARLAAAAHSWTPTSAELTWGAKAAWRNSTRCVGRLYWEALEVRDLRDLATPRAVYETLLAHLTDAFCGGHIRPIISVFGESVRLHNPQLIRYADDPTSWRG